MNAKVEQHIVIDLNPVLSVSKDGAVVYSNEASEPLLNEWDVKVGEKVPSSILDLMERVISRNSPEKIEVKVGNRVYLIVFHPVPEQECVHISGFDISDQRKLGEESHRSEERLNALMDHNPSLVFMKDECGRYVYLNKSYEKQFVHSKDWYGKTDFDFWSKESAELFQANDSLVLKSGHIHQFMEDSTDLNGTRYCWLNYKFPFTDLKNKRYVGGIGIDITDRKQAEEAVCESELKYRTLSNTLEEKVKERTYELEKAYNLLKESEDRYRLANQVASIGTYSYDFISGENNWSPEIKSHWGMRPDDPVVLDNDLLILCLHPEDRQMFLKAMNKANDPQGNGILHLEYRVKNPDGSDKWLRVHGQTYFKGEGINRYPYRAYGATIDITDRKLMEEAIVNFEITRQKEIHHRIKNNLQVISSLLDLQAEKLKNRKCIKDCQIECIRNSEVLEAFKESKDRVISMALIHEELHKGGQIDTLNISHYIEDLADNLILTYRVGNNGIKLDTDIEEDIFFDMDTSVPIGIIINELVSNSLKHAFPDRDNGEIQIKLQREDSGEFKIEGNKSITFILSVSDNGIGIPEDLDIEDLDSLGLQLVTTLVDQLDGELELKRDNDGTEFIIRFEVEENNNLPSKTALPQLVDND